MATLNLSTNGPSIKRSYQHVIDSPLPSGQVASSPTYGQWAVFSVTAPLVSAFQHDAGKESVLKVQSTGEGELVDLIDEFLDGRIQFAFARVKDPNTTLPKCVLIAWCGEGVPERTKGYFTSHLASVSKLLHGYHVQVTARSDHDLTPEAIIQKVADASGAKYTGGPSAPTAPSARGPPLVASKPVFTPTRVAGSGTAFNPLGSRPRAANPKDSNVDQDGWGADAPPVTRTQLEKVAPAYRPTRVNIHELASQKSEPSRYTPPEQSTGSSDVVKGGYQPIGKVDIAAIRMQARQTGTYKDDRPEPVKGAYEPIGKVDIAAIRARAQGPSETSSPPANVSPSFTGASARGEEHEEGPKTLAERSAAFTQSERLTSLPKPKVANRFGSSTSAFAGTKAPTPVGFQAKAATATAPVGLASRTFADQGGKTPAQIWAEKKARERGSSGAADNPTSTGYAGPMSPIKPHTSGEGGWKSGYTGKTWAPVQTVSRTGQSATSNVSQHRTGSDVAREEQDEDTGPPAGGVSAIRGRFQGAPPMGAPAAVPRPPPEPQAPSPPLMDLASKPNAGARGVPIPGLPIRPAQPTEEVPEKEHFNLPPPPAQPRSPSPPSPELRPSSPIRVAMPVARGHVPEIEPPEERYSPPPIPAQSIAEAAAATLDTPPEPYGATHAAAASAPSGGSSGTRALIQYDYEKAEDNEIELREGEFVTNIDMVDEDWWMGTNSQGETGLFPSNYVELVDGEEVAPAPAPMSPAAAPYVSDPMPPAVPPAQAAGGDGATATALYEYDAAEDNELSFPDGAKITSIEFPDDDWWYGEYNGQQGLFPANYVQLDE